MIWQVLSAKLPSPKTINLVLLGYRILVAFAMIRTHGWKKIADFDGTLAHIPDPFGIGATASVYIAIFANVTLAAFVAIGLLTRLSALGILSVTLAGFFLVHFSDPWDVKDTPLIYSIAYGLILLMGPGRYSLDQLLSSKK